MKHSDWSDSENDLIVADYFEMLIAELSGRKYNKSAQRRALLPQLKNRSEGSVEFKHQNISAVLASLGEVWIDGYKPLFNLQTPLEYAVVRWLNSHPDWVYREPKPTLNAVMREAKPIWVEAAPTLSNRPPPDELELRHRIARKFDVARRDERNRLLGKAGEEAVYHNEKLNLTLRGRPDLADQVRWVSNEDGDGLGYDIASFDANGSSRLIEVKTTNGDKWTPFHISKNELEVSGEREGRWCLFRVWNFAKQPKAFEIYPPLDRHVSLTPTSFRASFG